MAVVVDMYDRNEEEIISKIRRHEALSNWGYVLVTLAAFIGLRSWEPFRYYALNNPIFSLIVSAMTMVLVVLFTAQALNFSQSKYMQPFSHPHPEEL
jgi:hypothetical protein